MNSLLINLLNNISVSSWSCFVIVPSKSEEEWSPLHSYWIIVVTSIRQEQEDHRINI